MSHDGAQPGATGLSAGRASSSVATAPEGVAVALSVRPHRTASSGAPDSPAAASMPVTGALVDRYGRVHSDLRLSITDRCNLRCVYCMSEDMTFQAREELLTFDEIERVSAVARSLGVTSVRLTGGEPLVRRGVEDLVARLRALGYDDIALTTNAVRLGPLARRLRAAGLTRVNVSCDSLRPERYASIRRRGDLATVLAAMNEAESVGLAPLKVNVVLLRGVNDDEVLDFASFARETGRVVRFIEFMPLDAPGQWDRGQLIAGREVLERIHAVWPIEPVDGSDHVAPAERFRFRDGRGQIGVISSVTEPFCGTCNRLRLTADGSLRNCLFANEESSVRDALRRGASDHEIEQMMRRAVWAKHPGHAINEPAFLRPHRSMSMIGG